MSEVITSAINKIKELPIIKKHNISDDCIFGIVCYKYFYNDGQYENSDFDISYTDGPSDGGIDLVAIEESDTGLKSMVLIQSKNIKDKFDKNDIKDCFTKMATTVNEFSRREHTHLNEKIQRIYLNRQDEADNDSDNTVNLAVFVGHDKSEDQQQKILEFLGKEESLSQFNLSVHYKSDIENLIDYYDGGAKWVDYGELDYYNSDNVLLNGENGVLVNAKALSIRDFYLTKKDDGLFEQNYRYFVMNKKIDSQINDSLENKREKFWFMNNGIIIACKDFVVDGNKIKLYDFSIVNGCQTTTLLGKYKGAHSGDDFPIACKIVKPESDSKSDEEFQEFVQEIAEASNSQKPISDRDLKSNQPVQKKLQQAMRAEDPKVYVEIKRGEKFPKTRGLESWQKVKNDVLGQLILSFMLQKPGTARSNKKKIFGEKTTYENVFHKNREKDLLVDLLQLADLYDKWLNNNTLTDINEKTTAKNGKLSVIAIIGFLIKWKRGVVNTSKQANLWKLQVLEDNIRSPFLNQDRQDDKAIFALFNKIVIQLKKEIELRESKFTSISNFFKLDSTYNDIILELFEQSFMRYEDDYEDLLRRLNKAFID